MSSDQSIEVEQKFRLSDVAELERELARLGAKECALERHSDTYYRHPSRDFAQTREALRIRRIITERAAAGEGVTVETVTPEASTRVTYKGPYQPHGVKARPELEWRIDPCDPDGKNMARLLGYLGLSEILTVHKVRRSFQLDQQGKQLVITIDDTRERGMFAEIETIAASEEEGEACRQLVTSFAEQLGLREAEQRSYLQMALSAAGEQ
jgi:adenylate cyclase, class 2